MKESVAARNAFAAAHSAYITLLKNTGAALNDYGQGESTESPSHGLLPVSQIFGDPLPPAPPLPPLPPPLPPGTPSTLMRSTSAPVIAFHNGEQPAEENKNPEATAAPIPEGEEDEEDEEEEHAVEVSEAVISPHPPPPPPPPSNDAPPPPPPTQQSRWEFFDYNNTNNYYEHRPSVDEPEPPDQDQDQQNSLSHDEAATDTDTDSDSYNKHPIKEQEKSALVVDNKIAEKAGNDMQLSVAPNRGGGRGSGKHLLQVLQDIDDQFLVASESGLAVSKMLEANRLHYHSNFADNKGTINHSEQVMRVITWNRSFKGPHGLEDGNDDMQGKEKETHASVLDKLLAWENKLYDEVKAGELMKIEYQKKIASLNKQKKRGRNSEALEKTKAAVKYLHTRYMVDFQAMDSTSSEIQRLRDEQLYPNLVELVEGMEKMWKSMYDCHRRQEEIVKDLRFDTSNAPDETTKQHHDRTYQLYNVANEWHAQSEKLFIHQKQYIGALNNWLRLNLIPIESNLKEKVSSPPKAFVPPIHELLQVWHGTLDQLPYAVALQGLKSFAAIINRIFTQQQEELKQKKNYEDAQAELERKRKAFNEWALRNPPENKGSEESAGGQTENKSSEENAGVQTEINNKDPSMERRHALILLEKRVHEEEVKHKRSCRLTRDLSLKSLETGLPALFQALVGLSRNCFETYKELHTITLKYNSLENDQ